MIITNLDDDSTVGYLFDSTYNTVHFGHDLLVRGGITDTLVNLRFELPNKVAVTIRVKIPENLVNNGCVVTWITQGDVTSKIINGGFGKRRIPTKVYFN